MYSAVMVDCKIWISLVLVVMGSKTTFGAQPRYRRRTTQEFSRKLVDQVLDCMVENEVNICKEVVPVMAILSCAIALYPPDFEDTFLDIKEFFLEFENKKNSTTSQRRKILREIDNCLNRSTSSGNYETCRAADIATKVIRNRQTVSPRYLTTRCYIETELEKAKNTHKGSLDNGSNGSEGRPKNQTGSGISDNQRRSEDRTRHLVIVHADFTRVVRRFQALSRRLERMSAHFGKSAKKRVQLKRPKITLKI
ncbi:hypothetical protein RF11_04163 [Thelohanellus kitauei]|uniref:Uncharacterized protein n=1 Tax=Thelohanellus kitauei TaxID=669202 RepID=A0A0C2MID3_THEKT|nr:hypothetical protein RF11_04163 [Thelohanellus kitauei]